MTSESGPYYRDDWLTIHQGDCRAVLATMPAESVHCVVTSPPYWGLRDYGQDGQLGLEPTPDEYVANMVAVFREVRRVLRSDGTVWLNLGDSYAGNGGGVTTGKGALRPDQQAYKKWEREWGGLKPKDLVGIPWRVAFALQADGWYLRSDIIWAKPNPMPESVTDRPTKAHEYLFLLSKSPRYYYDADAVREPHTTPDGMGWAANGKGTRYSTSDYGDHLGAADFSRRDGLQAMGGHPAGRNLRSVWTIATQPYPGAHFATFPEALVEPCVKAGTSEKGVCPECGAPWVRLVERIKGEEVVAPKLSRLAESGRSTNGTGGSTLGIGGGGNGAAWAEHGTKRDTTGWRPSCAHDAAPVPATVLDPFAGSGTTARVAQRLSRRAVLIDLNADYLVQAMGRNRDIPLGLGA